MNNKFARRQNDIRQVKYYWAYVLVLSPLFTDLLEVGHLPRHAHGYISETILGALIGVGVFLIQRDMIRLRTLVQTDALTGLFNRRKFFEDLTQEVVRAQRLGTKLSLIYLDVDRFKQINDHYGHAEGDAVLRALARMLSCGERQQLDMCYRLGGDEFAVLLIGANDGEAREALQRSAREGGRRQPVLQRHALTLSFGIAQYRGNGESIESFVQRADRLMYQTKRNEESERLSVILPDDEYGTDSSDNAKPITQDRSMNARSSTL